MTLVRHSRHEMLAGITPVLRQGEAWVFCTTQDGELADRLAASALARFREDEGITLIVLADQAARLGLGASAPMSRIVLEVFSALEGVGLTAAVAGALAEAGIPCNMVAGYHHDHVFVPVDRADEALHLLLDLQRRSAAGPS